MIKIFLHKYLEFTFENIFVELKVFGVTNNNIIY